MRRFHNSRENTHYFEDFILIIGITTHTSVYHQGTVNQTHHYFPVIIINLFEIGNLN